MPLMNGPTLLGQGDNREREFWPALRNHFPLYEDFWRLHVFHLRGADGYIRGDIDERLEIMAQEHYKCFISLHKAFLSLGDETHPEQTFSSLQNAGKRANQVVRKFNDIRLECVPGNPNLISPEPFAQFCQNIAQYRNQIHEDVMSMVEYQNCRYLPRPDKLAKYSRWSRLGEPDLADFTPLSGLLRERFDCLCCLLDQHWRMMLERSPEVLESRRYAQLVPPQPQTVVVTYQMVLSSNIQDH
jgi:hypothetical protein